MEEMVGNTHDDGASSSGLASSNTTRIPSDRTGTFSEIGVGYISLRVALVADMLDGAECCGSTARCDA